MIDIFEVQRLIDSKPEHSQLDTICMSIENYRNLNRYFTGVNKEPKYKGFFIVGFSQLDNTTMHLGKKPEILK